MPKYSPQVKSVIGHFCQIFFLIISNEILSSLVYTVYRTQPKSDVEVATFGKIVDNFSPIVPPSAAGVRSRSFRRGVRLVAGVGTF